MSVAADNSGNSEDAEVPSTDEQDMSPMMDNARRDVSSMCNATCTAETTALPWPIARGKQLHPSCVVLGAE